MSISPALPILPELESYNRSKCPPTLKEEEFTSETNLKVQAVRFELVYQQTSKSNRDLSTIPMKSSDSILPSPILRETFDLLAEKSANLAFEDLMPALSLATLSKSPSPSSCSSSISSSEISTSASPPAGSPETIKLTFSLERHYDRIRDQMRIQASSTTDPVNKSIFCPMNYHMPGLEGGTPLPEIPWSKAVRIAYIERSASIVSASNPPDRAYDPSYEGFYPGPLGAHEGFKFNVSRIEQRSEIHKNRQRAIEAAQVDSFERQRGNQLS